MQGTQLSLGLVVRNEASQIIECLENFKKIAGDHLGAIIIVDNDSADNTLKLIKTWQNQALPFGVVLIPSKDNNMALARNLILEHASTQWLYFTDADCRLQADSWSNLIKILQTRNEVGMAKSVAFGGGNTTPLANTFVSQGLSFLAYHWLAHMGSIQAVSPTEASPVALLSTCNLLVCVKTAKACGGFDEIYWRVGEDLSLSHRLRKAGHQLLSVPGIQVVHHQDRGLKNWLRKMFFYGRAQVHIAVKYPRHFWGLRGLQCLAVLGFAILMISQPMMAIGILIIYFLSLIVLAKSPKWSRLAGIGFVFLTHAAYAIGELSAILTLPIFALKTLPVKIPAREKQ